MSTVQYLTHDRLVSPGEKRYFAIIVSVSVILWLLIALSIVGLVYGLSLALVIWFANGLFIAHIKSEAVKVSESQLPELHAVLRRTCDLLGIPLPEMYVIQEGGALNAFATRRAGRDFVVLFSDLVEAYGHDSPEVAFVIGHELGHVARRHVLKHLLTLPGRLVPLLGAAYNRACEATCDRYGMFCAQDREAAVRAMMILSGGKEAGRMMSSEAFARQHTESRGFFVSWHELESGYPTLSQRVHNLRALGQGQEPQRVSRNALAYGFAILFSRVTMYLLVLLYIGFIANLEMKKARVVTGANRASAAAVPDEGYELGRYKRR